MSDIAARQQTTTKPAAATHQLLATETTLEGAQKPSKTVGVARSGRKIEQNEVPKPRPQNRQFCGDAWAYPMVASMLLISPCVRLDCVSSASKPCLDYVWSANVFMLSLFEQFCPPKFPFLLWLKLLVCCTLNPIAQQTAE